MHKWVLPLLLILCLFFPLSARAQDPITIDSLQVQIWPEYDQPSVLIIYDMTLSANTTYPAALSVRIPLTAGDPNAVATLQPDGNLYNLQYTRQVTGDWSTINFSTTNSDVRLEFYDTSLQKEGSARHYQYVWSGDYAVSQFIIQVQQPLDATDMRISPSLGAGTTDSNNLTYFTQNIGTIPAGQKITITIDYQKSTDALSAQSLPVQPSASIPQSSAPDLTVSTWLPWILGILGAGLIVGGIIWFWQTGRQHPFSRARRRRAKVRMASPEVDTGSSDTAIYCSQCGKRALPGDQFCRYCGTQIHTK